MNRINIKPLSVNECFKGRKFRTRKYDIYELKVKKQLAKIKVPDGDLALKMVIGVSSPLFDVDNALKPFIDIMQKVYKFNDRYICNINITKVKVSKGKEFIEYDFKKFK